jgi:CheY-like chemotaxis protein
MHIHLNSIAIIDDDEFSLLLIKKFIEQKKIAKTILPFSSGLEALNYFESNASDVTRLPSIVLLDITMPLMSGWQVLDELNKIEFVAGYKPPVCIISAFTSIDFEALRKYPLIRGYLTKPVIPNKLIALIESVTTGTQTSNVVKLKAN